ncbi:hypothetical protein VKT23_014614 [Stygiomarasmius scandens]|uniref:Uncharacterized protein n=1 Tax=Marasmiellus scandens TaxID=2682957 RepID=A0ABR1J2K0_9AGAR
MVHTRAQGYSDTSESALASAPADRTRSKTQGKPALQSERPDPRINRKKKTIKVPVVEITQTLSRLKAPASSVSRLQVPLSNQVAPVLQPVLDQELEPSASRAPCPKESAKIPGSSVPRVHLAPGQEMDTSVPRPNESDKLSATSGLIPSNIPNRPPTPLPSPILTPFPAALGNHNQLEALEMLDVSYADLDREELEYRKKKSVSKDNEQDGSVLAGNSDNFSVYDNESEWGGCASDNDMALSSPIASSHSQLHPQSSTPQEQAVQALREYVASSMEEDEIMDELQGLLGKLSSVWYEAITTATGQPDETVEERQQALEEYIPTLLHTRILIPSHYESTPPSTRVQSPTPQERAVDALRSYITSPMAVGEIADHLYGLLGDLSADWHHAITLATTEPDQTVEEVQEAFEAFVPSLLGHRRSMRQQQVVYYNEVDDMAEDDSCSSDWGAEREQEKALERKRRERTRKLREKNGEVLKSPEMSISDSETEEEDPPLVVKRPYTRDTARGKGQATSGPRNIIKKAPVSTNNKQGSDDSEPGTDDEDDEDNSGRVPAAMKAEIWRVRADYEGKMEEIARQFNHTIQAAYRVAGDLMISSRDPNLFNLFQKWYVAEDGNNSKVPDSMNPGTFLSQKWQELRREKLGEDWEKPDKVEEEFAYLRKWHSDRYIKDPKMIKGPSRHDVKAVAKIISDVAKQATLNRGLWVYAFIIDPNGRYSMISGWGKEFESMKVTYPTQISSQLHDAFVLFGNEQLKVQYDSSIESELQLLIKDAAKVGSDRGRERALVPRILLYDIGHLDMNRPRRFPWKNFADYAYKNQIRIENWPEDILAPGAGLSGVNQAVPKNGGPSRLTAARINELPWLKNAWERREENPTPPQDITSKALRVVSWTEAEKRFSSADQKNVALVKCTDSRTLVSVLHSKDWRKEQGLIAKKNVGRKEKGKSRKRTPTPTSSSAAEGLGNLLGLKDSRT